MKPSVDQVSDFSSTIADEEVSMAAFTVRQGKRYRAKIQLGWLEAFASNELIAGKLRAAGFSEVGVSGSGETRQAEARWPNADSTGEMPPQVAEIVEIIDA